GRRARHGRGPGLREPGPARPGRPRARRAHHREGGGLMPQGKITTVPDDGLTTRQRRARPLLIVHTGDGKGKSTAAFGMALRAWTAGWPLGVFPVTQSPQWESGAVAPPQTPAAGAP